MSDAVLDASAVLAFVHAEPGGEAVERSIRTAVISTVNWSEVCRRSLAQGADIEGMREEFAQLGLRFVAFEERDAEAAARLWPQTRAAGLSLADRACLALAQRLKSPVLTADRSWLALDVGVEVRAIR